MIQEQRRAKAEKIIDDIARSAAGLTATFSQIPGMGAATLTKFYLEMAGKIAALFDQKLESKAAQSLVLEGCARYSTPLLQKSVLGWIPLLGNIINAKITYDVTRKIGWFLYDRFDEACEKSPTDSAR
ncbi:MAG: hypothetical protein ACXWAS_06845 [Methylobacter sp.]